MPLKTCRYCLIEVETEAKVLRPICTLCQRKRQLQAVKDWYSRRTEEEVEDAPFVPKVMANRETMYYPWKLDPSVILVVEP